MYNFLFTLYSFLFTFTFYTTPQQHLHKHYLCISRTQKYYLKIVSQKLDLYTSIGLYQGFPNWDTCTPRGTFAYLKG